MSDLLTTTEVGRIHGVRRQSVTRWIDAGLLPAQRAPRGWWLVERADAEAFVPPVRKPGGPPPQTCTARGCTRPHHALGWCKPHHRRLMRTGNAQPDVPVGEGGRRVRPRMPRVPVPRRVGVFDRYDTDEL